MNIYTYEYHRESFFMRGTLFTVLTIFSAPFGLYLPISSLIENSHLLPQTWALFAAGVAIPTIALGCFAAAFYYHRKYKAESANIAANHPNQNIALQPLVVINPVAQEPNEDQDDLLLRKVYI